MSNKHIEDFNKILNAIPVEEFEKKNKEQQIADDEQFESLKKALRQDMCSYCGNHLSHFSERKPCFHWLLLKAKGFKKRHFPILFQEKSYHELEAYLRWVANIEQPIKNINDLTEERSSNKFIETTIKYKDVEWSFSCAHSDLKGHPGTFEGTIPHYHFQMKKGGNVIIKYRDFHIPFQDYDEFCFAVKRGEFDRLRAGHFHGAGMQALFDNLSPEELFNMVKNTDDIENAQFNMSTLLVADEGTTISGDDIANMLEERKRTGVPLAKLVRKLKNISSTTFITPGEGVPEIAKRKARR